jgi:cation:H+ antiporter
LAVTTVSISTGLAVVVFLLGLGLSLGASEVLVTGLGRLGGKLGLAAGLLGLLVALGADAPEISSAITALLSGAKDVGLGVILGSNLFNLAALLGLSSVIAGRLHFRRILVALDGGVALLATGVIALLLLAGLSPIACMVLLAAIFLPYLFLLAAQPHQVERLSLPPRLRHRLALIARLVHPDPGLNEPGRSASWAPVWWIVPSVAAIVGGSYAMVTTALVLADRWHVSRPFLGTVILAAITSLPNAYAAVRLALRQNGAAVVSEAFNSNTLNLLAGIGVPALVVGSVTTVRGSATDLAWVVGLTVVALGLGYAQRGLSRVGGVLLIAGYLLFLGVQTQGR